MRLIDILRFLLLDMMVHSWILFLWMEKNISVFSFFRYFHLFEVIVLLILYIYLMGPFNAGPNSALFLGVALIRAGVRRAGVKWAILKMQ